MVVAFALSLVIRRAQTRLAIVLKKGRTLLFCRFELHRITFAELNIQFHPSADHSLCSHKVFELVDIDKPDRLGIQNHFDALVVRLRKAD